MSTHVPPNPRCARPLHAAAQVATRPRPLFFSPRSGLISSSPRSSPRGAGRADALTPRRTPDGAVRRLGHPARQTTSAISKKAPFPYWNRRRQSPLFGATPSPCTSRKPSASSPDAARRPLGTPVLRRDSAGPSTPASASSPPPSLPLHPCLPPRLLLPPSSPAALYCPPPIPQPIPTKTRPSSERSEGPLYFVFAGCPSIWRSLTAT